MDEAAALAVWARASDPESPADLSLILGMPGDDPEVVAAMGELALDTITASLFLLPVSANLRLVKTNFPIVCAWSTND